MVTIKDIAKNTGVSISTVSRVINGNNKVNPEIKEKVMAEIKKLGYIPNVQAQTLSSKKSKLIGVIVSKITNPYFSEILNKIEQNMFNNGYEIIFMNTNDDKNKEKKCISKIISRNLDGIIIAPSFEKEKYMQKLIDSKIPVVAITKIVEGIDSVAISHEIGGELVAKHFIDLGHEKIGFVSDTNLHEKFDGFYKELKRNNINFNPNKDFFDIGINDELSLREKIEICLNKKLEEIKPFDYTAIYASNDVIAFECINFFEEKGYRIPEDIAICGFDGTDFARVSNISTISQPTTEIVNIACNILMRNIKNNENLEKKEHIEIVPRLITRKSTLKVLRK